MQDERRDNETGNEKRKGDEVEQTGDLSGPKKVKIALNHLVGADDDAQEESPRGKYPFCIFLRDD